MADTDVTGAQVFALQSRSYGLFGWGLVLSAVLLLLVVVVLTVVIFVAVNNTALVLTVLVVCLIVAGALACFFLEWLRRRALKRRDEGANDWIRHTLSQNELGFEQEPSSLPESNTSWLTPRSSWIHWAPWRFPQSNGSPHSRGNGRQYSRSTGPPSSRSTGPESTRSNGPPSSKSTGPESTGSNGPPSSKSTGPESTRSSDSPSYTILARSGL